ncbi:jg17008 [Pararge aegeria aegeria]|uniref:Jg17008 protein n=1 Tax=Pararge aegeria aegeria TaxID=348720 RepID=A0A8S4R8U7_9NEOP|nr:jg17008 [Pararge aegeria aegeria]
MRRCHIVSILGTDATPRVPARESYTKLAEFAIANVQCQYECSDTEPEEWPSRTTSRAAVGGEPAGDHTYDTRDEPPAFIIHQLPAVGTRDNKTRSLGGTRGRGRLVVKVFLLVRSQL